MNIQDKQPQEIGVWMNVNDRTRVPDKHKDFVVKFDNGEMKMFYADNHTFALYTHWLSPQTAVVLSVEEWERVKKCLEAMKKVYGTLSWIDNEKDIIDEALQQLNQQP